MTFTPLYHFFWCVYTSVLVLLSISIIILFDSLNDISRNVYKRIIIIRRSWLLKTPGHCPSRWSCHHALFRAFVLFHSWNWFFRWCGVVRDAKQVSQWWFTYFRGQNMGKNKQMCCLSWIIESDMFNLEQIKHVFLSSTPFLIHFELNQYLLQYEQLISTLFLQFLLFLTLSQNNFLILFLYHGWRIGAYWFKRN